MENYEYHTRKIIKYCFYKAGITIREIEVDYMITKLNECLVDPERVYLLFVAIKDEPEYEGVLISILNNVRNNNSICKDIDDIIKNHRKRSYYLYLD